MFSGPKSFRSANALSSPERPHSANSLSCEIGATLVESAIALSFLLLFLLVSLDLLWAGFRAVSLQYVAEQGLRMAVIDGQDPATVRTSILDLSRSLGVELDPNNTGSSNYMSLCPVGTAPITSAPCPGQVDLGNPGDRLVLRIEVPLSTLLVSGIRFFPGQVIVENRANHEYPI